MYIKSIILEGFKSYGQRTEVNGFDREFNAITGLNGSGKSNILDAICFVLGISNLGQVRAGSLQDLVYKSGQAGITKASVTIKFDNIDQESSPIGYEQYEEITVTRQTVVGGKNKYLINGSNATNKRVMDMFCSVQLNVNNPHFLIMQGRITKVLNMKPVEILSMIEEAAGTRMYEGKKQAAYKTIEKKDAKLNELKELIQHEIGPRLQKLKDDRVQYLEYQKVIREVDHLTRIHIAYKYLSAEEGCKKAVSNIEQVKTKISNKQNQIVDSRKEIENLLAKVEEINSMVGSDLSDELKATENSLKEKEKIKAKYAAQLKNNKDSVVSEQKRKKQLEKSARDDEAVLQQKLKDMSTKDGAFSSLKDAEAADAEALAAAQRKYQAISAGLLSSSDGQDQSLQEQLMATKQSVTNAKTQIQQCQMEMAHNRTELASKEKELGSSGSDYAQDSAELEKMEKEVASLEANIKRLQYEDGAIEHWERVHQELNVTIRSTKQTVDQMEARHPHLTFNYTDPEPNFDRRKVKGLVCRMFTVKDARFTRALESAAGGRLFFVVTDTEETSKKLLQRGQLQRRVTVLPLNRITGQSLDARTVNLAKQVAGADKVFPALDLIEFEPELLPAMQYVFGQVFICVDSAAARAVTFHNNIRKRSVTLDGDNFDPAGTMSGGAALKTDPVLTTLQELKKAQDTLATKRRDLTRAEGQIRNIRKVADEFKVLQKRYDLRSNQLRILRERLQQTDHHQLRVDVDNLKTSIKELTANIEKFKETIKEGEGKVKTIENRMKNAKKIREDELKATEEEMARIKKRADESRKKWKTREEEYRTMNLEITELQSGLETIRKQIKEAEDNMESLSNEVGTLTEKLTEAEAEVSELEKAVKKKKEEIASQNEEIQTANKKKDSLQKLINNLELEIKKLEQDMQKIDNDNKESKNLISHLTRKYEWIETDKQYFGKSGGVYDFKENNPKECASRLAKLEEVKEKLGRTVNTRAMNLLSKEEEQYNEVMRKKNIVENDKAQIMNVILELDEKKKKALQVAWTRVNKDFGSIFSTLLPGSIAKLEPPPGQTVLDGLEVKIGFGDIWKESLSELSGGQRSLVALSLILAMLLFKPAPIYILDEVDAALDLSHTQNIGTMLKKHFTHSQFIVVSLKDGMFNNANVLYRTRFVDGMSTVSRTVQHQNTDNDGKDKRKAR